MSATTEYAPVAHLRRIGQLVTAGASNATIADTLRSEGIPLPRDGAFDNRHAPASGYNIDNGLPGDPSRWTAAAVAAVRASSTYTTLAAAGFVAHGSVQLTI